ncbi:MAG TPA: amidohydrolase family protein, partial [Steroidobacteraceae bacterium]
MNRFLGVLACTALVVTTATRAAPDTSTDLVLLHGRIHTEDPRRSVAEALAVRGNTIVAVGTDRDIGARIGPHTRTLDLRGRVVLPGIIDAHTHPAESAQDFGKCSLNDHTITPQELVSRVRACVKSNPGDPTLWFE